ncbi:hypothetical protein COOONC_24740 [Cooperia oncophora]
MYCTAIRHTRILESTHRLTSFLNLFSLMLDAGIHNISEERDKAVFKVEERLQLDLSDEAASVHIFGVIETSMNFLSMNVGIVMDVLHDLKQNLSW